MRIYTPAPDSRTPRDHGMCDASQQSCEKRNSAFGLSFLRGCACGVGVWRAGPGGVGVPLLTFEQQSSGKSQS
jgi:hypothetical protein